MSDAKTGECRCSECASLCQHRPGVFAPGEATKAAAELGLPLKEFFERYCTVNYWSDTSDEYAGDEHICPAWTPENKRVQLGSFMPLRMVVACHDPSPVGRRCSFEDGFSYGPCALLGPNGCRLSHDARPEECRRAYGCEGDDASGRRLHAEVCFKWRDNPGTEIAEVLWPLENDGKADAP